MFHHYIEGTTEKVPLKDGNIAEDVNESGKEGENYTTSATPDDKLSDEYELSETPSNANGIYNGSEVIVTYYYKKVSRDVNLIKYQEDGATPLEGAKFTIKSKDDVIKAEEIQNNGTYYFEKNNGKYISNNKNKSDTTANSYMKIDMTKASEDATITVNAEISSESNYDYGYATITQAETAPVYNTSTGRFVYISGTQSAKDYSTTLAKGKVYYLHLGYRKDGSGNTGADTFTVNSIKINGVDYLDCTKGVQHTTDANGKISWTGLQTGLYLLVPGQMQKYRTDPSLVSIPTNLNAQLLYDMSVNPKAERIPDPVYPPEESEEPSTPEVKKPPKKTETIVTPGITPEQKTPEKLPQTGQLRWPILALSTVGAGLLFLGWWIGRKKKDCSKALMGLGILLAAGAVGISAYNIWDSSRAEAAVEASLEAYEEELTAVEQESEALPVDENSGMTFVEADGLCWIGELEIPSLQLTLPVADPWSYPSLKKAPCRYTGSAKENSLIIAAHNYKRHFGNIGLLPEGATVKFTAVSGDVYEYEVEKVETLNPYAVDEMLSGDWDLTLFTCTYGGRKRVTVRCSLVG